ncbi:response regulator [Psychrosphaera sp. B3R10]|uniref:ATP-binding protein n=1 Tax=unclassified Psychrosphaera TaxID=2641570 RepID=UPI001C083EB5|nr:MULTISPECIES: ATP-binding protein [unclassified Psychrosphaera]MBU2881204.1 response regulator [Psychrosphaera sp. I2R16]MBU2988309.1 response regulator [Psychrosphaera sp. B3R10]
MKTFLNWFQTKSGSSYLVLFFGFVLTTLVITNFVSERASISVTKLLDQHTQLQAEATFNVVEQFVDNRIKILNEIAISPIVVSSVMGLDVTGANLADHLTNLTILGEKEAITVANFNGDIIYPLPQKGQKLADWTSTIDHVETDFILNIAKRRQEHFFQIAVPIKYNGLTEGAIVLDIRSHSIESLIKNTIENHIYEVLIKDLQGHVFATNDLKKYRSISNAELLDKSLVVQFYISREGELQEKSEYINRIGTSLIIGMSICFVILVMLIRSILISPLQKLAHSQKRLKHSEERYQLAIQGSNDGIWDWDFNDDSLYLSPRFLDMLEVAYDENTPAIRYSMAQIFNDFVHVDDKENNRNALKRHLETNVPYDFDVRMGNGAKPYRYFRVRGIVQRNEAGRAIRMAGSLSDIDELRRQQLELENALKMAKSASKAKTEFLANMSHEIRTPMNGVLGSLQVLQRMELPEAAHQLVDTGIISSQSLLAIINDILDLSKIESNNVSLEMLPTDVVELMQTVKSEFALAASQKKLDLNFSADPNMHKMWIVDPVRIKQIITNLCSNAVKFTGNGSVKISLNEQNECLVISVTDTGIGLSNEQLGKLFNRFEQADSSTTRKYGGTGLGLAISKKLAEIMGGDIEAISEENRGSCFTLRIPAKKSTLEKVKRAEKELDKAPDITGKVILLAEDNKINQTIFCSIVKPTNAIIDVANDGVEAVIAVNTRLPEMIFMDIQMPNMDGVEACAKIKAQFPHIPIIALTANVMNDDVKKYMDNGFDSHLAKPINIKELYKAIRDFI